MAGVPALSPVPALLLTGTIGSGKTVVGTEVGVLLEERGVPSALVDLDWLSWMHLGPDGEALDELLLRNLAVIWPNFMTAGARAFVLIRAVQRQAFVEALRVALPDARLFVVRLVASDATIDARLRGRDTGSTLEGHLRESAPFAEVMDTAGLEGAVVRNEDRSAREVAAEVIERWEAAARPRPGWARPGAG